MQWPAAIPIAIKAHGFYMSARVAVRQAAVYNCSDKIKRIANSSYKSYIQP